MKPKKKKMFSCLSNTLNATHLWYWRLTLAIFRSVWWCIEKMWKPEAQQQVSKNITHCSIRQHCLWDKKKVFTELACKCLLWSLASKLLCKQVILHWSLWSSLAQSLWSCWLLHLLAMSIYVRIGVKMCSAFDSVTCLGANVMHAA